MNCQPRFPIGPRVIYTKGSTSISLFFAATGALSTADIDNVRASFELNNMTADMRLVIAYQLSDDPCGGWAAPVALGGAGDKLEADGPKVPQDYTSLATAIKGKLFIRFGFLTVNVAGTGRELGEGSLRLDFRRC